MSLKTNNVFFTKRPWKKLEIKRIRVKQEKYIEKLGLKGEIENK